MRERFEIDSAHTDVGFSIRHLVISKVRGSFTGVTGYVEFDPESIQDSTAHVTVDMRTIDTNDQARDEHLRSPDFFDVERYPEMTFDATSVRAVDERHFDVTGDLTIHGVTKPITLSVTYGGRVKDPWGNDRVGFEATGRIDRKEYGLTWNAPLEAGGVLVGDSVDIQIETECVKQAGSPQEQEGEGQREDVVTIGASAGDI